MAFLPSLQEAVQPYTGQVLLFQTEQWQGRSLEVSINPDVSIARQDLLQFDLSLERGYPLRYDSFLESQTWKTEATTFNILLEPLQYDFSSVDASWAVGAAFNSTHLASLGKLQIWTEAGALITWTSQSKDWGNYYSLILDLQDLLLKGQIWKKSGVLADNTLQIETLGNWSSPVMLFEDLLVPKEVFEESASLEASSYSMEAQPLDQVYTFRKPAETQYFLEMNPFLRPLLREAYPHIRQYFPFSKIFLEAIADREVMDEEQLVMFIVVDDNPDEASEALNRFDDDWWLDAMERAKDKLCITLEFQ